jgi:hypothetical protein
MEQGLRTNNLVLGGSQEAPISLAPAAIRHERKPGGYTYTVSTYQDPAGCLIGERWIIDGMPHAWPGGSADPKWSGYSDPKAPSGAEGSWAFLRRYTKRDTAMPCAEAPAPRTPPVGVSTACRARWLTLRLPSGTRTVRATVNGRRASVRATRRSVRVRLPATRRSRTKVVVRWRTRSGKRVTRRYSRKGCWTPVSRR